jgi:ADP-ribose pyrophosphatase
MSENPARASDGSQRQTPGQQDSRSPNQMPKATLASFPPAQRQLLRRGSRFDIELVSMPLRHGGHVEREVIRHPGSVLILPLLEEAGKDPQIVFIRNWRISLEAWLLELPAGTMHAGEDPKECAARELEEETGYRANELAFVRSFLVAPGLADERMHFFVARGLSPTHAEMDEDERIVVCPMGVREVMQMLERGEIDDAKTMLGMGLVDWTKLC